MLKFIGDDVPKIDNTIVVARFPPGFIQMTGQDCYELYHNGMFSLNLSEILMGLEIRFSLGAIKYTLDIG